MKKLFFKLTAAALMVCSLGACTNKDTSGTTSEQSQSSTNSISSTQENESFKVRTLDDVCTYLVTKNIVTGEKHEMSASMIGAQKGYAWSDSTIEVYEFATKAPKSVSILGIEVSFDATNEQFALVFSSGNKLSETVKANAVASFKAMIVVK